MYVRFSTGHRNEISIAEPCMLESVQFNAPLNWFSPSQEETVFDDANNDEDSKDYNRRSIAIRFISALETLRTYYNTKVYPDQLQILLPGHW